MLYILDINSSDYTKNFDSACMDVIVLGKFGAGPIGTRSGLDQTQQSQSWSGIFQKILDCLVSSLGIPILPGTISDLVWTRTA